MKKQIIYSVAILAVSLTFGCQKASVTPVSPVTTNSTPTTPVTTTTDSFTVNGTSYSVDQKITKQDSALGKPLTTYGVLLIHGTVTSSRPNGDYAIFIDSIATQVSGTFNLHNALSTLPTPPCGAVYYDNVTNSSTTLFETLSTTTGSMIKTGARSFSFTATVSTLSSITLGQSAKTAQISATISSF